MSTSATGSLTAEKRPKGHPPGLYLLFSVELWERFSYYGMRAILSLYMAAPLLFPEKVGLQGLGMSKSQSGLILGVFQAFVYLTPIIGGYIADNYLGRRKSIYIGGILMALGQFTLASQVGLIGFYAGLIMIVVGNGFFKPNISTIVGSLYSDGDKRRDAAFTIFYMGINIGAFLSPLVCGWFISEENGHLGFRYGFLAAGIGMVLSLIILQMFGQRFLGDLGKKPEGKKQKNADGSTQTNEPLTNVEKDRIAVIFIISAFVTVFWMGFDLAPTAMTFFTDELINRNVGGFTVPTAWFQSINPLLIVGLAPVFATLWTTLGARNREPNVPQKMALGIILAGAGFLFMYGAVLELGSAFSGLTGDAATAAAKQMSDAQKAGIWWVTMAYVMHTLGELCLSPVGLSMVTKLAPARLQSMLMGVWFFSVFLANILAGLLVGVSQDFGYESFFLGLSIVIVGLGLVLLILSPRIKKMMHGVE